MSIFFRIIVLGYRHRDVPSTIVAIILHSLIPIYMNVCVVQMDTYLFDIRKPDKAYLINEEEEPDQTDSYNDLQLKNSKYKNLLINTTPSPKIIKSKIQIAEATTTVNYASHSNSSVEYTTLETVTIENSEFLDISMNSNNTSSSSNLNINMTLSPNTSDVNTYNSNYNLINPVPKPKNHFDTLINQDPDLQDCPILKDYSIVRQICSYRDCTKYEQDTDCVEDTKIEIKALQKLNRRAKQFDWLINGIILLFVLYNFFNYLEKKSRVERKLAKHAGRNYIGKKNSLIHSSVVQLFFYGQGWFLGSSFWPKNFFTLDSKFGLF